MLKTVISMLKQGSSGVGAVAAIKEEVGEEFVVSSN